MSAQSSRPPSPADLARARRSPTAPPPGRGRKLAEAEKDRALRASRALVADQATDFATLDAGAFFTALRCACQDGTVNTALIAEVARRCNDDTATSRDVHQVLFAGGSAWEQTRGVAMDTVARRPHLAVEVVQLEVQRLGTPPMRFRRRLPPWPFSRDHGLRFSRDHASRARRVTGDPPCVLRNFWRERIA